MSRAFGLYFGKPFPSRLDLSGCASAGVSFVIFDSGIIPSVDIVQKTWDAGKLACFAVREMNLAQLHDIGLPLSYWENPSKLEADANALNNPEISVVKDLIDNSWVDGLFLRITKASVFGPTGTQLPDVWVSNTYRTVYMWLSWHIHELSMKKPGTTDAVTRFVLPAIENSIIKSYATNEAGFSQLADWMWDKIPSQLALNAVAMTRRTITDWSEAMDDIPASWTPNQAPCDKGMPWGWRFGLNNIYYQEKCDQPFCGVLYNGTVENLYASLGRPVPKAINSTDEIPDDGQDDGVPDDGQDDEPPVDGQVGGLAKAEWKSLFVDVCQSVLDAIKRW